MTDSQTSSAPRDGKLGTRWGDFTRGLLIGALSMSAYHTADWGGGGPNDGGGGGWSLSLSDVVPKVKDAVSSSWGGSSGWDDSSSSSSSMAAAVRSMSSEEVASALEEMGVRPIRVESNATEEGVPSDPSWKRDLYSRLNRILLICGELCRMNDVAEIKRHYQVANESTTVDASKDSAPLFPTVVTEDVPCRNILGSEDVDAGDMTFPSIPSELRAFYTLGGALHISNHGKRRDARLGKQTGSVWMEDDINTIVASIAEGKQGGNYGVDETNEVRDQIVHGDPDRLRGKSVLVIGSTHPWVECICLHHGARLVTTLEYGTITSHHPRIRTETPDTFRAKYLNGTLDEFDGVVTHSSLEHSGLGRYGDALNPWGDILALARAWCVTKSGGFLWLGLPVGKDMILSNWHRVYGKIRLPLMAANWRQLGPMAGVRSRADEEEIFRRGIWKSMAGTGHLFEKVGGRVGARHP